MSRELHRTEFVESLYEKLTNEEDARACRDISDEACRETPGNFFLVLSSQFLTKLGDALTSPKTVLAWAATSVGAPTWVLGLLVPIRESGSLIPQLAIGSFVRRAEIRKWYWVIGSVLQGLAVLFLGWVVLELEGVTAGLALLGGLTVFSLSRGLCSVASKDVLGKTVPKGKRGQLTGWSASAAGLISIAVGVWLLQPQPESIDTSVLAGILALGAALWFMASAVFSLIREEPGETDGGFNALKQSIANLSLLATDAPFRRFVLARSLLMCSALSAPFYVALAQERSDFGAELLGAFIVADGMANLVSAPVWGRFADFSSRLVMASAAGLTATMGIVVALFGYLSSSLLETIWAVPLAYFVLSVAHSGVRVGRKTYVVDLGDGSRRTDYVSVSNSVIGVLLLVVGLSGSLAGPLGISGMIGLLSLMGICGAALALTLRET